MEQKLNFIHVCDYASLGEGGKLNVLGIFENIFSKNVPVTHPQLYIVVNVSVKKAGNYKLHIRIVRDKDSKEIIQQLEFPISINLPSLSGEAKVGVIGQINGIKFEEFGGYTAQVLIDANKVGETKINLTQVDQK